MQRQDDLFTRVIGNRTAAESRIAALRHERRTGALTGADNARNHGQFVSCVSHLTNDLKNDGMISGREKGAIQNCAAEADLP